MIKKRWLYLSIFIFIVGLTIGIFISQVLFPSTPMIAATPTNPTFKNCPYQYINQLRCEPDLMKGKKEYTTLRNDLTEFIQEQERKKTLTAGSVYFRDLQNGQIIDINGNEDFAPASLLKVPLMMTYYRKAQDDPTILQRNIPVDGNFSTLPQQNITPEQSATIGKNYTIDQLVTLLITQSDNISWEALLTDLRKNYSEDDFIVTLNDLGIIDPRKDTDSQFVTVQEYAAIFRLLYNSSYLNPQMSDKALQLLTQSDYNQGLVAGVAQGIKVAHKFGERKAGDDQQLHDCGIVYYPPDPYVVCIMTRGHDIADLEPVIQKISQIIFTEVQSRN